MNHRSGMLERGSLLVSVRTIPLLPSRSSHGCGDLYVGQKAVHRRQSNQQHFRTWQALLCFAACLVIGWQLLDLFDWSRTLAVLEDVSRAVTPLREQQSLSTAHQQQQNHVDAHVDAQLDSPNRLRYPIWWHAPFYTGTGYSTEGISYVTSLLQTRQIDTADIWISHSGDKILEQVADTMDSKIWPILQAQEYASLVRGALPQEDLNRPAIAVCHSFPDCWLLSADRNRMGVPGCPCPAPDVAERVVYRVGRTMFETDSLPAHLVDHCNAMDEVWVPTEFNRATFAAAGVSADKLHVVPQGIDAEYFHPDKHKPLLLRDLPGAQIITGTQHGGSSSSSGSGSSAAELSTARVAYTRAASTGSGGPDREPYVFMSVFKWEARKGWDVLLSAFLQEFPADEAVELHIITKPFGNDKQSIPDQVRSYITRHIRKNNSDNNSLLESLPRVYIHTHHIDDATYPRLYASCDCVVLPTRGEGWGRPQMEAMAMAKPVITTNWSGPTAYINDQVGYPLSITGLTAADLDMNSTSSDKQQINEYFVGQMWAQPNVTHLRQLMRHVFLHPEAAAATGAAARAHILQNFTPSVIAGILKSEFLRIEAELGPDRTLPDNAVGGKQKSKDSKALCMAYPDLCKQGEMGVLEASRRAQSAFTHYKSREGSQIEGMQPGGMTVQEIIAYQKRQKQQQQQQQQEDEETSGQLGTEIAVRPSGDAVAVVPAGEIVVLKR